MATTVDEIEARLLADPDDAAAWRAYVPWLRERGDPRSELFELDGIADTPHERKALADQIQADRVAWTPTGMFTHDCTWRHGFAVGATFRIAGRSDARALARMLADRHARLLGSLRLVFTTAVASRALADFEAADFSRLHELRAGYHTRGSRVALALAAQPALRLRTLDLRHTGLTDDALLALATHPQIRALQSLHLQHNRLTARSVAALAHSPALSGIEHLDLRDNQIGEPGAAALASSPHLGRLTALLVNAADLTRDGVRALAGSTALPRDIVRFWRARDPTP